MIIMSWNCWGLGCPSAVPNLQNLARGHKPDILFLSETLANTPSMENIRVMLGYDSCLAVDVEGVGTKGVSQNHLLSFDNNKVLKIINWTC